MRFFITLLLVFISSVSLGQGLVFRNYTTADGLNTNTIHNVFQDSRGYIWLSTDLGVTRFDGNEFKSFTESDGLVGGQIFGAAEDSVGNVWFHSFHRKLAYYSPEKDSFYQPSFNDSLASIANHFFHKIDFYRGKIILSGVNYKIIEIAHDSNKWVIHELFRNTGGFVLDIKEEGVFAYNVSYLSSSRVNFITTKGLIDTTLLVDEELRSGLVVQMAVYNPFRKSFLMMSYERIIEMDSMLNIKSYPKSFLSTPGCTIGPDGKIWMGSLNSGLFEFENEFFSSTPHQYLNNQTVTGVLFDKEGGMWVSTIESGLFYSVNSKIRLIGSDLNGQSSKVKLLSTNDTLVVLSEGVKRAEVFTKDRFPFAQDTFLFKRSVYNSSVYQGKFFFREARGKKILFLKDGRLDTINNYIQDFNSNDVDFIGTRDASEKLELYNSPILEPFGSISDQNVKAVKRVFSLTKDRVYLQLYQNLIVGLEINADNSIQYDFLKPLPEEIEPVSVLSIDADTSILFTKKSGAFLISGNTVHARLMLFYDDDVILNDVFKHREYYLLSTSKGVFRIDNFKDTAQLFINQNLGLPSDYVVSTAYQEPYFIIASNKGVAYFKAADLEYEYDLPIVSLEVHLNGKQASKQELISMTYDFGTLNVKASCISYVNAFSIRYRYRFKGDIAWSSLDGRSLTLSALQPGEYSIEFQAEGANGNFGDSTILSFNVNPPFWQKPLFFILSFLGFVLIGIFVLRFREHRLKRQLLLEEELLKAQNQALSSQLKPHFIFNSMNSLVAFITTKDEKNSLRYLANLSKLMRSIFDSSESNLIMISKEIESLEHYLELEKLRFDITYEIECDKELASYLIPPLLLQPLVENAVIHGVEKGQGMIRIHIQSSEDVIIGSVENTGNSLKVNQLSDRIGSLSMIKRRLEILKTLKNLDIGLKIEAINEDSFVTRAQIAFPKLKA